jgi:uncharacterized protein YqeY
MLPPAMTSIHDQIEATLRTARLARDTPTKTVLGMLKAKVLNELKSGKVAEETDELWLATISAYAKQLNKSIPELEKGGERSAHLVAEANFELEFCQGFLPTKLDEAATEKLVRDLATEHSISDPKLMGKLMGLLMKNHKDEIDGDLTRKIVQRVLGEG